MFDPCARGHERRPVSSLLALRATAFRRPRHPYPSLGHGASDGGTVCHRISSPVSSLLALQATTFGRPRRHATHTVATVAPSRTGPPTAARSAPYGSRSRAPRGGGPRCSDSPQVMPESLARVAPLNRHRSSSPQTRRLTRRRVTARMLPPQPSCCAITQPHLTAEG